MLEIAQGVEHRLQMRAGQLEVERIGKRLQVNIGGIHFCVKITPGLRVHIARSNRHGLDAAGMAGIRHIHGIFGEDDRVVVGKGHALAAMLFGGGGNGRW